MMIWVSIFAICSCGEENNEEWTLPANYESLIPDNYFHFNGSSSVGSSSVYFSYEVSSSNNLDYWGLGIKNVEYLIDDQSISSSDTAPYRVFYSSNELAQGSHKFTAKFTIGGIGKKDVVKEQVIKEFTLTSSGNSGKPNSGETNAIAGKFWIEYDLYVKKNSNMIVVPHIVSERSDPKCVIRNVEYTWDGVKIATAKESPYRLEYKVGEDPGSSHNLGVAITYGGEGYSDQVYNFSIGGIRVMESTTAGRSFTLKSSINNSSEYEYKNGETLSAIAKTFIGDESSVSYSLKVYWDDTLIGESSTFPYNLDYKIENQAKGTHVLKQEWTRRDANQGITTSQSQTQNIKIID